MSAVGFDLGNENSYIAAAKSGGIEILDNEYNLRATPTYIAFTERSRDVGIAAKSMLNTNLDNTVFGFKKLLGRKYTDADIEKELNYIPHEVTELSSGDIGIKLNYLKENMTFSVSQLMAMMLSKLKTIAENKLRSKVRDCVLSIPVYYTDAQRRAMLDASKIAGLNVLKLMSESTAVSLAYGFYRHDLSENDPANVIFVDLGHSCITVTACAFTKDMLKILGCVWDDIGGRDFDNKLVQYFVEDFKSRYHLDVTSSKKAVMALLVECESLKKMMSANSQEIGFKIEYFMQDHVVQGRMKREMFENLSINLLNRIEKTLQNILDETRLNISEIYSVEIIGGSSRLPAVKRIIQNVFGQEPNLTLNQDEAVAKGCALQCALLSHSLKTRNFVVEDVPSYVIKVAWENMECRQEELEVFSRSDKVPAFKMVYLFMNKPFSLDAYFVTSSEMHKIGSFAIGNIPQNIQNKFAKIKVNVCLDSDGIFLVTGAKIIVRSNLTNLDRALISTVKEEMDMEISAENASMSINKEEKEGENKFCKSTVKSYCLTVTSSVPELSESKLNEFIEAEQQMFHSFLKEKEKADARNTLEEYIYEVRGKLSSELNDFVMENDKVQLLQYLYKMEDWLYDNEEQEATEYSKKLMECKNQFDPIFKRFWECENRPSVINEHFHALHRCFRSINELEHLGKTSAHQEGIENLRRLLQNSRTLLDQSIQTFSRVRKYSDVSITIEDLKQALSQFQNEFETSFIKLQKDIESSQNVAQSTSGDGSST